MLDVCAALLPALAASVWHFGARAFLLALVSVGSCVAFEALSRIVMKRPQSVGDCSAIVTGLLLAFNLPPALPLWMVPIGALVAIVIVKQLFGGIGQNFANPAITARIVLLLSFPAAMTGWSAPCGVDAIASATPLKVLGEVLASRPSDFSPGDFPSLLQMLLGQRGGSLGETCAAALLLGGLYLCIRKVITPLIPLCYIGVVALCSFFYTGSPVLMLYELLGGGLLLGAVFMATDYSTSPVTRWGKVIFAVGCGLLTCLIRFFGNMPEGVSFAILLMNLLSPHIENLTAPKAFGKEKRHAKA
jgi:electron transport complex protein RnfD